MKMQMLTDIQFMYWMRTEKQVKTRAKDVLANINRMQATEITP